MNTTLWIIAGVMTAVYLGGGACLVLLTKQKYRSLSPTWQYADDFGGGHLKAIGTIKMVGAVGLVLPPAVGVATVLTPLAASGLTLLMAGAVTTRFRRNEWTYLVGDVLFLALLAFLAWGRFSLEPF